MKETRVRSILLIEDELLIREYIKMTLQEWGYSIAGEASTGEDAVDLARERTSDLILMDIRLKGEMDGIEAARNIRTRSDVPILFMSAYEEKDITRRDRNGLGAGYIKKPIDEENLRRVIGSILDER